MKINRITTARIEKFIVARQNEGMNLTTLRKLIVTLNQIMKYAVRHRYIDYNPVRDAERPKDRSALEGSNTTDGQIRILNPEEIQAFLEAVDDQKYYTLFKLAIASGARQGELFGLKRAGLERMRFHDLRHTFASLLIELGENIKYIQTQLGHAGSMVTLGIYARLITPVNQSAAIKLEKPLFEKVAANR